MTSKNVVLVDPADRKDTSGSRSRREPIPTGTTRILLVILKGHNSHVSVDDMFWVFSQFGVVEKLSSFSKNSKSQILVQYESTEQAGVALSYLNSRDLSLASGPCRLEIVPSFLKVLTFKKLDSRNREFATLNAEIKEVFPHNLATKAIEEGWAARDFVWGEYVSGEGWLEPMQERHERGTIPRVAQATATGTAAGLPQGKVGDCMKLSGISESDITAEILFRVAGMYGQVISAKMMAKRKGCALIQYACREMAEHAIEKLDKVVLFGTRWEVVPSKHANALHWDGAGTELQTRMCTVNDVQWPAAPPPSLVGSPSHYLGIHGFVDEESAAEVLREALRGHNPAEVSSMGEEHPAVAGFETKEQAFLAAGAINGKMVRGHRLSVYFLPTPEDDDSTVGGEESDEALPGWLIELKNSEYRTRTLDYHPSVAITTTEIAVPRQLTL